MCFMVSCVGFDDCEHVLDEVGDVEYRAVVVRYRGVTREEEVASCSASGLRFAQIAGVAVRSQDHLTRVVCDDGLFLRRKVIEEL